MPVNPPSGYHTITPFVIVRDSKRFLAFLADAFGAEEMGRVESEDGSIGHAESSVGDSVVMMFDPSPDGRTPGVPPDLRRRRRCRLHEGAEGRRLDRDGVGTMPWGDRAGRVRDPLGNLWWIMSRVEDLSEEEIGRRMSDPQYLDALAKAESSEIFPVKG